MLRWMTAGESHGQALIAIIEGLPSGLKVTPDSINQDLSRRQLGFGRGGRMELEKDRAEILSGVRRGRTIGSPVAVLIRNLDWQNWQDVMSVEKKTQRETELLTAPRPGHADFAGCLKMGESDIRNVLERASARETAARVAIGALAKTFLAEFKINVFSHVLQIGTVKTSSAQPQFSDLEMIDRSPVRCFSSKDAALMSKEIEKAVEAGDSLGGVFEVIVHNVPPGLGSHIAWDERLDGRLARAVMSIPAIKGVEIGDGFRLAGISGSQAHDQIYYQAERGFYHGTNRAGGLEGGITNGEQLVLRAAMKPIPTLKKPLDTVDMKTREKTVAFKERADVCAVPAAAVVGEAVVALEIALAFLVKFGGDCLRDIKASYRHYLNRTGWKTR